MPAYILDVTLVPPGISPSTHRLPHVRTPTIRPGTGDDGYNLGRHTVPSEHKVTGVRDPLRHILGNHDDVENTSAFDHFPVIFATWQTKT